MLRMRCADLIKAAGNGATVPYKQAVYMHADRFLSFEGLQKVSGPYMHTKNTYPKKQYAGMQSDQVRELKQLQEENARLKKLVAELSLDKAILQDVASKKWPGPR